MGGTPQIHLVLTDDWELRGDGSGNPKAIQFDTMHRLAEVYERHGLRASFNAEVMQQLAARRLASEHPELAEVADGWDAIVREMHARGHDVQLHVHPQWSEFDYIDGHWRLSGAWSLLEYPAQEVRSMLASAKEYLEGLLGGGYRCVAFRSGSWCIAPSPHVLGILAELGIVVDSSIVKGLHYDSPHVKLDYRNIDEPFLPYYPRMDDARRLGDTAQPIVIVPTHSFHARLPGFGLRLVARTLRRRTAIAGSLTDRFIAPRDVPIPDAGYDRRAYFRSEWDASALEGVAGRSAKVSDLCGLSYFQTREMLRDIRRRARSSGAEQVPVIVQNHTKDIGDFAPLKLFAAELASAPDIHVITLTELARNLGAGAYPVRVRRTATA